MDTIFLEIKLTNGQVVRINPRHIAAIEPLYTAPETCCYVRTIAVNSFVDKISGRVCTGPAGYEVNESSEALLSRIREAQAKMVANC